MKKVIIFGGGISGLTVAHALKSNAEILVIEKDTLFGGMAKSRQEANGTPSEHSWRGYAPFYMNTFNLMMQIPTDNLSGTVYDNLSLPLDFYLLRDSISTYKPRLNFIDTIIIFYYGFKYLVSDKRRDYYYTIKFVDLIKNKLSRDGYNYLVQFMIGPGLGMDKKDVSFGHFFKVPTIQTLNQKEYEHTHMHNDKKYIHYANDNWHVLNKPTNEAWIDPWVKMLRSQGIKLQLNTKLVKFNKEGNKIISCVIDDGLSEKTITADEYILCINPFDAEEVFYNSGMNKLYLEHKMLNQNSLSKQVSFRIGINKKIQFPSASIAFAMVESEFDITWYPQEYFWGDTKLDDKGEIKSLWSGTILDTETLSKMYNKPADKLNKKELMNDIINQILRSKSFQKIVYDNNGFNININDIIYTEIWYEWNYINGELEQSNKKWLNNIYNEKYRPDQVTDYDNLYIGGAHTKTSINIWSMEGAIESGLLVASKINNKNDIFRFEDLKFLNLFKIIDNILYKCKLPNIVDIIIFGIVIVTIIMIRK